MDNQIEKWRVLAFAENVYHLSQQRGSRLSGLVRHESFTGKAEFFDTLGLAVAQDKSARNSDTPNMNIDHERRMITTLIKEWGTLVDRKDKLQNIHNPESEYSVAAQNALGRAMDDVLIKASLNSAKTGEDGSTLVSLPNTQKVASVKDSGGGAILDYANVQVLRKAKLLMDRAEVMGPRYMIHGADFLEALLSHTEVTSSDFNTVKALVNGEVDTFLGFKFIHSEIVSALNATDYDANAFTFSLAAGSTGLFSTVSPQGIVSGNKVAVACVGDGLIWGENTGGRIARIEERADKGYSNQVYTAMDMGGLRMEEVKVVQLYYKA